MQQASAAGCVSSTRTPVTATILSALNAPVVTVGTVIFNLVTFNWNAVIGAAGYEISIDNGATYIRSSSGSTGLTYTINGLTA